MAASKVTCPHCHRPLKATRFVPPGQEIICPNCQAAFKAKADVPIAVGVAPPPASLEQGVTAQPATPLFSGPGDVPVAPIDIDNETPPSRRLAILCVATGCLLVLALSSGLIYFCFFGEASPSKLHDDEKAADSASKLIYKLKPVTRPLIELTKEDQECVQQMTRKAVEYLKKTQNKAGSWDGGFTDSYASLVGLTLLESGVPATDPVVKKAAEFARSKLATLFNQQHPHQTYTLSLTLLFFDKLADPADKENLKKIALRLMAGQSAQGGWSYQGPILSDQQLLDFGDLVRDMGRASPEEFRKANAERFKKVSPVVANVGLFRSNKAMKPEEYRTGGDNSNTQFALLALWAARRHGLPVDPSLELVVGRFRNSQNKDGSFNYSGTGNASQLPTMTCAGLLGLAVGYGLDDTQGGRGPAGDAAIQEGLKHLSKHIGTPPKNPKEKPAATEMYFLWSLERVAVLYQLRKIHDKEWFPWGLAILKAYQTPEGNWLFRVGHGSDNIVDTCFALLFLQRVNLAKDLTDKLTAMTAALEMTPEGPPVRKE